MNSIAIILAAGASRRMGRPKALLQWAGESFIDHVIGLVTKATGVPPIVVLGHHADQVRGAVHRPCRFAVNPDPERGMLSSLQCGLRLIPANVEAFLFTPVDYPAISLDTIRSLLDALHAHPTALFAIPRYDGRRGHPVTCHVSLAQEILDLPEDAQPRDVVHAHVDRTIYLDTPDAGIHQDVDFPEDYERLLETVKPR